MERMKAELEGLKGYSIKKLFGKLDKQGRGFIDVNSIRDFMQQHSLEDNGNLTKKKLAQQTRRLTGLMRRIVTSTDGRITFTEFAKVLKPVDLRPYLKRIRKFTKEEKK